MKICIDLQCIQGSGSDRGVGQYALSLVKELIDLRVEISILINKSLEKNVDLIRSLGVEVYEYEFNTQSWQDFNYRINTTLKLFDFLIERGVHVYHIMYYFEHESSGVFVPNLNILSLLGMVTSCINHDLFPIKYSKKYLIDSNYKSFYFERLSELKNVDIILHNSTFTELDYARIVCGKKNVISKVVNGGPTQGLIEKYKVNFFNANLSEENKGNKIKIFYPSGPDYRKNNHFAVQVFEEFKKLRPNHNLSFVISNSKYRILSKDIEFVNNLTLDELVKIYIECDIVFFPSIDEGLGMPILDAVLLDKKIAISDTLEISSAIDSKFLFDPNDIGSALLALDNIISSNDNKKYNLPDKYKWRNVAIEVIASWKELF